MIYNVRIGGLMRCCIDTLDTHDNLPTIPGDTLCCKHGCNNGKPTLLLAEDGVWEWTELAPLIKR